MRKFSFLERHAFNIKDKGQFIYFTPKDNLWFVIWLIIEVFKNLIIDIKSVIQRKKAKYGHGEYVEFTDLNTELRGKLYE